MEGVREGTGCKGSARASSRSLVARKCECGSTLVSTIRVSTHLPPIRAHRGGIVRGRRGRERRAGSCGLGETQNALPDATATDIRRTRTDISTRCSVMRCVPPLGTRPNTRRRMGCAPRWRGMDEERLGGGRHGKWTRDLPDPGPRVHHTVGIRLLLRCRARTVNFSSGQPRWRWAYSHGVLARRHRVST